MPFKEHEKQKVVGLNEEMDSSCKQRPLILQDNSSRGSRIWSDIVSINPCEQQQ